MDKQEMYAPGAPCWVDTWQPDPRAATRFYGALLGWRFDEPAVVAETGTGTGPGTRTGTRTSGEYHTGRLDGRRVAGVGQGPAGTGAVWTTSIRVEQLEAALVRVQASGGTRLVGPVSIGSDGRLAMIADPEGVGLALWEAGERVGAELSRVPGTWAMSSLHTTDPERAAAFYRGLFGWTLEEAAGAPFSQWQLDGELVAVMTATDGTSVPAHWSVNIAVSDVDAACHSASELGGTVLMAPFGGAGMRNAVVADPQGGVIAVSSPAR